MAPNTDLSILLLHYRSYRKDYREWPVRQENKINTELTHYQEFVHIRLPSSMDSHEGQSSKFEVRAIFGSLGVRYNDAR